MNAANALRGSDSPQLSLLALRMRSAGRSRQPGAGFGPLKAAVGNMISDLHSEQQDDDEHLAECKEEIASAEVERDDMESTITSEKSKMDALKVEIGGVEEEKKALETEIKELDEAMAAATATREKEKTEFTKVMSELSISSSLLMKAKEVMEKVYAPKT